MRVRARTRWGGEEKGLGRCMRERERERKEVKRTAIASWTTTIGMKYERAIIISVKLLKQELHPKTKGRNEEKIITCNFFLS